MFGFCNKNHFYHQQFRIQVQAPNIGLNSIKQESKIRTWLQGPSFMTGHLSWWDACTDGACRDSIYVSNNQGMSDKISMWSSFVKINTWSNLQGQTRFLWAWPWISDQVLIFAKVGHCSLILCKAWKHTWGGAMHALTQFKGLAPTEAEIRLVVLRFYSPINPIGSCQAQSVCLTTLLLGRLSPLRG